MFSFDTHVRVRYADTDQMQVVYHGKFVEYFEAGRTDSMRSLGIVYKDLEKAGILMPVVSLDCKFIRPAKYDDLLTVRTILEQLPTNHAILFKNEIYNADNQLLCVGYVKLYFMDKSSFSKISIPEILLNKLSPFFENTPTS
jgi:acyl-CoA thioester hydrolase